MSSPEPGAPGDLAKYARTVSLGCGLSGKHEWLRVESWPERCRCRLAGILPTHGNTGGRDVGSGLRFFREGLGKE